MAQIQLMPLGEQIDLGGLPDGIYIISRLAEGRAPEFAKIMKVSR